MKAWCRQTHEKLSNSLLDSFEKHDCDVKYGLSCGLEYAWDQEGLLCEFSAQLSIIFEGFKKKFLLLLGPCKHDGGAECGEKAAHPRFGHNGVGDPSKDLPCVVGTVDRVETPSSWDSSLVVVNLSRRGLPQVSEGAMTLVVEELEQGDHSSESPVEVLWPVTDFGFEEEDLSHHQQPIDEPVVQEVLCRPRNWYTGVGEDVNILALQFSLQVVEESNDCSKLGCVRPVLRDEVTQRNGQQRSEVLQNEQLLSNLLAYSLVWKLWSQILHCDLKFECLWHKLSDFLPEEEWFVVVGDSLPEGSDLCCVRVETTDLLDSVVEIFDCSVLRELHDPKFRLLGGVKYSDPHII